MRRYCQWAGNPKGIAENTAYCVAEVWPRDGGMLPSQCGRKRGHGADGLYCAQHARMIDGGRYVWVPEDDGKGSP